MDNYKKIKTSKNYYLAYNKFEPSHKDNKNSCGNVEVVFLSGFMSDMQGTKAKFVEELCRNLNVPCTRFDYFGHGNSDGDFENGTISIWKDDVLTIIDKITNPESNLIIIGSSMGGWLMLLAVLERADRIKNLIGIAAAPDFTEKLLWDELGDNAKNEILEKGVYYYPTDYCNDPEEEGGDFYPITRELIEDGRKNLLLNNDSINLNIPIRLIHGMKDGDVPYSESVDLADKLKSDDVEVILCKDSSHRMSNEQDLKLLKQVVESCIIPE